MGSCVGWFVGRFVAGEMFISHSSPYLERNNSLCEELEMLRISASKC